MRKKENQLLMELGLDIIYIRGLNETILYILDICAGCATVETVERLQSIAAGAELFLINAQ